MLADDPVKLMIERKDEMAQAKGLQVLEMNFSEIKLWVPTDRDVRVEG